MARRNWEIGNCQCIFAGIYYLKTIFFTSRNSISEWRYVKTWKRTRDKFLNMIWCDIGGALASWASLLLILPHKGLSIGGQNITKPVEMLSQAHERQSTWPVCTMQSRPFFEDFFIVCTRHQAGRYVLYNVVQFSTTLSQLCTEHTAERYVQCNIIRLSVGTMLPIDLALNGMGGKYPLLIKRILL